MSHRFAARALAAAPVIAAALLAGCAGLSPPTGEISQASAAVSEAIAATRGGQAAAELARAQQKLALTGRFMDAKDYRPARWLAEQAEVDAELALARSASEQALLALAARERARDIQRVTWWRP